MPVKGTMAPSFMTVKDFVGNLSSRMVAYLSIFTDSVPVFVMEAVSFSSSIDLTLVDGPDSSTVRPSNRLKGPPRTVLARARATKQDNMLSWTIGKVLRT
jgi:hypothetical protein